MKDRLNKFFGLVMFLTLTGVIISLGISSASTEEKNIFSGIEISGGSLLSSVDYRAYAGLKDSISLRDVTLPEVKKRFEKHPYIIKADVEFDGESKILVEITERNFTAVLFEKQKFSLLTENYELVPILKNTEFYELPIIINRKVFKRNKNTEPESDTGLEQAFKIIDALKFCDEEMFKKLAEINLHKGGDVILTFSGMKFPVIFGRGNEAKKVLVLKSLWQEIQNPGSYHSESEYLDLRFSNQVFIGQKETNVVKG